MRHVAATVAIFFACVLAAPAYATTYYVSAQGTDAAAGTSEASAWRTVGKVNTTALQPGDVVLFRGGDTFSDTYLGPKSGTAGAPITYSSFGTGRATLTRGVWFASRSYFVLDNLKIDRGPGWGGQGIASSARGAASRSVTIRNCVIVNVTLGIQPVRSDDANWLIENNVIDNAGDSGILLHGSGHTVVGNTITNTGRNSSISYGKHGVYSRSANVTIQDNVIRKFQSAGVSVRYRNSAVVGNRISGGAIGISWFQYDTARGNSKFLYNTIDGVTSAGIYVDPNDPSGAGRTVESFVVAHNTIDARAGAGMNLNTSANLVVVNNVVTGTPTYSYQATSPGSYTERNNLWFHASRPPSFNWNGRVSGLAGYRSASGAGADDVVADPLLDSAYRLRDGSPAIDRGSSPVWLLASRSACDGTWHSFCGSAPDLGTFESAAGTAPAPTAQITSPSNGATLTTRTFAVTAEAAATAGIAQLAFFLDDGLVCEAGPTSNASCTLTADSGWHSVRVQAVDAEGVSASATIWVRVKPRGTLRVTTLRLGARTLRQMSLDVGGTTGCTDFRRPYWCSASVDLPASESVIRFSARAQHGHWARLLARTSRVEVARVRFFVGKHQACVDRARPFSCSFWMARGRRTVAVLFETAPMETGLFAGRLSPRT
jgi:parallel beta-helix repeat protein